MFSVVFEVLPAPGREEAYLALAREMKPILESMDGFLDNERFASRRRAGWMLSLSTWRDEKSVIRWRTEGRHRLTQGKGRAEIFSDYHLRVGEIVTDTAPPAGIAIREQRFDATEIGQAKALTLSELSDVAPSAQADIVMQGIGLQAAAPGLIAQDAFESLTVPGRMLALAAWSGPEAAASFTPTGEPAPRHRMMRVIRDYSLRDRREAPQHHPEASRAR